MYSLEEVNQLLKQERFNIALACSIYCDERRGYLQIGADIRSHYGIVLTENQDVKTEKTKTDLRLVK